MTDDPFLSVKAQLDTIATSMRSDRDQNWRTIKQLRDTLEQILELKDDAHGNSVKLAKLLAEKTLEDTRQ